MSHAILRRSVSHSSPRAARPQLLCVLGLIVLEIAAFSTYLVKARRLWFYNDEWDYIVDRHPFASPGDLLRSHNGQWQTIPILVYRGLLQFTGVRTYAPFLVLVVLLYLAMCTLMYLVLARSAIRPWIALVCVGVVLFLGFANENIVFGAQITYLGSLDLGLAALLACLSGGVSRRRIVMVAALQVSALMCSNLGVITAVAIFVIGVRRHGWRVALATTVPAALAFSAWSLQYGLTRRGTVDATVHFVLAGLRATAADYTQHGNLGALAIALMILMGAAVAFREKRAGWDVSLALAAAAIVFWLVTGNQRADVFGVQTANAARYVGVSVILLVPLAAHAAEALLSSTPPLGVAAVVILLMGVPHNLTLLSGIDTRVALTQRAKTYIVAMSKLPETRSAPAGMRPFPEDAYAPWLTVGWLRNAARQDVLPRTPPASADVIRDDKLRLTLYQHGHGAATGRCQPIRQPRVIDVAAGGTVHIAGGFVQLTVVSPASAQHFSTYFNPNKGGQVSLLGAGYRLRLASRGINGDAKLCAAPAG